MYRITYPNDTTETYTYAYGNWNAGSSLGAGTFTAGTGTAVKMTVTYGTTANPNGVANKTGQQVTIFDGIGNVVMKEKYVYTGSGFERFGWTAASYDAWMRPLAIKTSNNELTEYTWNCCLKTSETLPDGTQYTYAYDALKRLISKTKVGIGDQPDLVTSYTYDAQGRVLNTTISGGNLSLSESSTYNYAGQITSTTDQSGVTSTYTYLNGSNVGSNLKGKIGAVILSGNRTQIKETLCDGQLASITGNLQPASYFDYGVTENGEIWIKNVIGVADGSQWKKEYHDMLNRKVKVESSGFNGVMITEQYFYNTKNQLTKIIYTGQPTILFEYDALSNQIQVGQDGDSNATLTTTSSDRILLEDISMIKESNIWYLKTVQSTYGSVNNSTPTIIAQTKTKLSALATNTISDVQTIDINGNITTQTNVIDRTAKRLTINISTTGSTVTAQQIYLNGLLNSQKNFSDLTIVYHYDGLGRTISEVDQRIGTQQTTYYSSGEGRVGKIHTQIDAAGNTTIYDYDAAGNLISLQNPLNQKTYYSYNNMNQITRVWGNSKYPFELKYDSLGQLTQLKTYRTGTNWSNSNWPGNNVSADVTYWTYDSASGLVTAKTDAAGKSTTYTYTPDGKLLTRTWSRLNAGQPLKTTYSYDTFGQLHKIDYSDSTPDITYTYNRLGQPLTVTDAAGTRTLTYNAQFALQKESINGIYTKELNRVYTTSGLKGSYSGLNIGTVNLYTYGYDQYSRLNKVTTAAGVFNYTYLANSDLIASMTRPNNVPTNYTYETARDLLTKVANGAISTFQYANDALGRRTSMNRSGSAFTAADVLSYTYNSYSELTGASSNNNASYSYSYTYDPIGNRKTAGLAGTNWTYTANSLNQYSALNQAGTVQNPTYDADGNMLTRDGWTQTWNAENRLIKAEKGTVKLEFAYDYMGRRIEKKVYNGNTLTSHIRFVYDGYKLIEELNGLSNNAVLRRYVWQPVMLDSPLIVFDAASNKNYFYHTDANKNVTDLTESTGAIVAHYKYSPFGQLVNSSGTYSNTNVFTWSSEYADRETDLIYYNFREYDPKLGRWLSQDSIEEKGDGMINN
ncbi:RHS repeat domain-containing protein [Victivallis sp. Marseille-Q1083]|uniref:RHS repeat domain-containing protein n=1 Tax=Victivallis sp. Marseille-Q1083 TaxID=2717288 RepID=UPI00158F565D|nr:RHS repeat protein [Victivallis sp. Marseille-Q1083]